MNSSVPIEASGIIPVAQSDVAGIPSIALSIPDFEGQAILRIFANSTESEIACYSAVVTNGASFSHPAAVGTVLGLFTLVALVASFATATYGEHFQTTRTHYAHSLSVFVIFSVWQHIFYTGALSMNWPSVLPAFWSNFAWASGMIYTQSMQNSINQLIGSNKGNTSFVGAAGSGVDSSRTLGGGYSISAIYKRSVSSLFERGVYGQNNYHQGLRSKDVEHSLAKRALANSSDGFSYYGSPVKPGVPLPGNFSGFAGTLSEENIPASNAFMTGFLWLLILMMIVAALVVSLKWILEGLGRTKFVNTDRMAYFRKHWLRFTVASLLRTAFIGFFMMMFLTMFQFTYKGSAGVTAIAALVFFIFFVGMLGVAGYACYYRLRYVRHEALSNRPHFQRAKVFGFLPWFSLGTQSRHGEVSKPRPSAESTPKKQLVHGNGGSERPQVHEDEDYLQKFGWLSARFRRTKWWFFAVWLVYEFVRACFFGGAAGHPLTQVFGLLVIEFIALIFIVATKPFEGVRLNVLMVYMLGFSKVATVALSSAFDPRFNLARITTTVIGIVIIVIQGILAIVVLIAIAVGSISSYMSVTRNQEQFIPRKWEPYRQRYFAHLEKTAPDVLAPPPPPPSQPEGPKAPYFNVGSVRRVAKIEDEDEDNIAPEFNPSASPSSVTSPVGRRSRAASMRSQYSVGNVPFGARVHRASWSSRDVHSWHEANQNIEMMARSGTPMRSNTSLVDSSFPRVRTPSRPGSAPLEVRKTRAEPLVEEISREDSKEEYLEGENARPTS